MRASTGNEATMGTSSAAALAGEDQRVRSSGIVEERDVVAGVEALTEVPTQEEVWELAAFVGQRQLRRHCL